jgi:predicted Zn-dependent peptidase
MFTSTKPEPMTSPTIDSRIQKFVLQSGVTLLTEQLPERRSLSVGAWLRRGSRDEPQQWIGVTHFLEHMLFKGTERRTPFEIAYALESLGGGLDAFTAREYVCVHARCLEEHGELAIELLADVIGHSTLTDEEIEREKSVVREEIQSYEDNPEEKVQDVLAASVWERDSLGWPILGTLESIEGLGGEALRSFYRDQVRAHDLIVAVAGNFDPQRVCDHVAAQFDLADGSTPPVAPAPTARMPQIAYLARDVSQLYLALGRPAVRQEDRRRYALAVLNALIGGGMSSRLFQSVREVAGLAYSIYSGVDFFRDTGFFTISLGVRPERAAEALRTVARELETFVREGPSREELEAGRSQLKGGLVLGQESVTNHMSQLALDELYHGQPVPLDEHLALIGAVTADDVMDVAQEFLRPGGFSLAAVGPEETEEEVRKAWVFD